MWDLAEIFQNDSDIHVDDDEKCNDEVGDKIQYRHPGIAAVAVGFNIGCRIVASRGIYHHTIQNSVPTSWRRYLPTQWYMTQQLESNGSLLRQCNSDSLDYKVWEATLEHCMHFTRSRRPSTRSKKFCNWYGINYKLDQKSCWAPPENFRADMNASWLFCAHFLEYGYFWAIWYKSIHIISGCFTNPAIRWVQLLSCSAIHVQHNAKKLCLCVGWIRIRRSWTSQSPKMFRRTVKNTQS